MTIEQRLTTALSGGPSKDGPRWQVTGRDPRGEQFTTRPSYRTYRDAADFAEEVTANGGNARVKRVR